MCMGQAWDTPVTAGIMVRQADQARPAAYEAQMTLQFRPTTPRTAPTRPALDGLTAEGRDALLDLMWAAWYSSRTPAAKELLADIESGDPLRAALAAGVTTEASLKLMRLRRVAVGDPDTIAIIDALREGAPHLHVPMRLRRVMAASDDDRRRMLVLAQDEIATLPPHSAEVIAAVLGYLVGTEVDFAAARIIEVQETRGFSRAVMQALGLPFGGYMARVRAWL